MHASPRGLEPNPDAGAEALRAAGYRSFACRPSSKPRWRSKATTSLRSAAKAMTDEDARDAMEADVSRIVYPFGGEIDCGAFR